QQQAKGRFRGLVTLRDEIARFTKARTFPDRPVDEPVELHDAQASFQLKWQQTQYSNEFAIVKLAERYVQALAVVHEVSEKSNQVESVLALDNECDRVVALARLRQALDATKVRPPTALSKAQPNAVAASGANDARIRRPLDIYRPSNESLSSTINYETRVVLYEDMSQLKTRKSAGAGSAYRSLDGQVGYVPRITVTCHHGEVLSGSRLVIEYFSRSLPDHVLHREVVEKVLLPRLERSKSFTVEAKGLQLNRSESVSVQQYAGVSVSNFGAEFYGMILHLVDPDGRVLPRLRKNEIASCAVGLHFSEELLPASASLIQTMEWPPRLLRA
ncbi:MAG: hypothetical protein NTY53_21030, partial [Kiritimatiellaeota bacterium]|nr:hypothetical protein [Kiritimatiellota bacterium]